MLLMVAQYLCPLFILTIGGITAVTRFYRHNAMKMSIFVVKIPLGFLLLRTVLIL